MIYYQLKKNNNILINYVEPAFSIFKRMRGLLGRKNLPEDSALYIKPCGSIHTCGMKFSLDVIFIDKNMKITKIAREIKPLRAITGGKGAVAVLELQSGWFNWSTLNINDKIILEEKQENDTSI